MSAPILYDNEIHLERFRAGEFPKVHRPYVDFIASYATQQRYCDLGSGLGLLGEELTQRVGLFVLGVERRAKYIERARAAGVRMPMIELRLLPDTIDAFAAILRKHAITGLICRRSLDIWHEIGDNGRDRGKAAAGCLQTEGWHMTTFATACREAGIREIFLQGDNRPSRWEVEFEIACFEPVYRMVHYQAPTRAYLTLP